MTKCSVHGKIKFTASLVATVCVPAKLGHVFAVGSLGCAQKSFGEVAESPFGPEQSYTNKFGKKRQLRFIMQHTVSHSCP